VDKTSEAVIEYNRVGIQLLPLPYGSKAPTAGESWKAYTRKIQTEQEVRELFPDGRERNVAWIAGTVSGNLAIADFDARWGIQKAVEVERFRRFMERTSVSRTGSGKLHVAFRTPFPCKTHKVPDFAAEIRGEGAYSVEPFSLHPDTRQPYLWEEEFRPPLQIADPADFPFPSWLLPYVQEESKADQGAEIWTPRGLGARARSILAGNLLGYPSRSEAEYSVIVRAVGIGWTPEQVQELFRRLGACSLRSVADPAWLRSGIDAARKYVETERSSFDRELDALQRELESSLSAGPTGWTDRAVSLAIVQAAREVGPTCRESFGLSERELAERAGINRKTAAKALRRLGLPVEQAAAGRYSARYDARGFLAGEKKSQVHHSSTVFGVNRSGPIPTFSPVEGDAVRRKALGPSASVVLGTLSLGAAGRWGTWSERWGLGKTATLRRLRLLCRVGIMEQGQERTASKPAALWTVKRIPTEADLPSIAYEAGTLGDSERQRKRHAAERATYRRLLDWRARKVRP
jgi:hypothetical protein